MQEFPWEQVIAAVVQVAVVALLMERALALVFEQKFFVARFQDRGIKEFIALGVAWGIVTTWDVDMFSRVLVQPGQHRIGLVLTAMTIAGGSKVSQTLFELWNIRSTAAKVAANGGQP